MNKTSREEFKLLRNLKLDAAVLDLLLHNLLSGTSF